MRAAMEAQGQLPPVLTTKYHALAAASGAGTSVDPDKQNSDKTKKHPLVKVRSKDKSSLELSQEAETILDTGEIKLVKSFLQGSAGDADSAPMFFFGFDPTSYLPATIPLPGSADQRSLPPTEEEPSEGQIVPMPGASMSATQGKNIPAVNLSQFDQFSILHFQDKRDPEHNIVMIETPESKKLCKANEVCTEELSLPAKPAITSGVSDDATNGHLLSSSESSDKRKSLKLQGSEERKSFEEVLSSALARATSLDNGNSTDASSKTEQQSEESGVVSVKKRFERQDTPVLEDSGVVPSAESSQSGVMSNSSNFDENLTNYEMDSGIFDMRDSRSGNADVSTSQAVAKLKTEDNVLEFTSPILEESKQQSVLGDRPTFSYRVFQIQEGISFDEQTEEERLQQIDGDEVLTAFLTDQGACATEKYESQEKEVAIPGEYIEPIATELAAVTGTLEDDEDDVTGIVKDIRRSANIPDDLIFNEKNTSMENSIVQLEHEISRRDLGSPGSPVALRQKRMRPQTTFNPRARHQGLNILSDAKHPIPAPGAKSKYSTSLPTAAEVEVAIGSDAMSKWCLFNSC